jgi:hypothetical protein
VGKFTVISKNEPLRRGGGKPHVAEECCRVGGTAVMVHRRIAPNGLTMDRYNQLPEKDRKFGWRPMTRDATVYVRGKIRHPDHKTLKLRGWHRVDPNTEQARGWNGWLQIMAFLD